MTPVTYGGQVWLWTGSTWCPSVHRWGWGVTRSVPLLGGRSNPNLVFLLVPVRTNHLTRPGPLLLIVWRKRDQGDCPMQRPASRSGTRPCAGQAGGGNEAGTNETGEWQSPATLQGAVASQLPPNSYLCYMDTVLSTFFLEK